MAFNDILQVVLVTMIPTLELRASLPYAIWVLEMPWYSAFILVVIINIILGPIVYFALRFFLNIVIKIPFFNKLYERSLHKVQTKIQPKVEKYGEWGLALFIGIPLPGSGVYTGALAAFVLDIKPKKFMIATVIGVLIAALIVLLVVLAGSETFNWILIHIQK
ncbi:MAG: small multi-drug export protein [Candidatus Marinimicrobia bacterium]|nr:small multi-drug export protein [Candidatus Neomarinimicrobiota bacterium]